jgi:geranylgeranyl diphosphate synthase type I
VQEYLEETARTIDRTIEKYIPRVFTESSILFKVTPPLYSYNCEVLNKALAEPIWNMLDRGGKRWRPALFLLVVEALGKHPEDYLDLAIIPEVVHNGTLIIDDIEDASEMRRGKPCVHRVYGVDIAVNAGNMMYYLPLLPLMEKKESIPPETLSRLYEIYVQEMIKLSLGQAMDIAWHRGIANADEISEDDYLQMCAYKTGTLARMAARIASVAAGADDAMSEKLGRLAESIGVAFQIRDDILDLTGLEFADKKGGLGQDITEGKRTLMVIHTLQRATLEDRKRLIEILNMHTSDQTLRNEAIKLMQKYGAVEYAKRKATCMVEQSWATLDKLLPLSDGKEKLKAFAMFLVNRNI